VIGRFLSEPKRPACSQDQCRAIVGSDSPGNHGSETAYLVSSTKKARIGEPPARTRRETDSGQGRFSDRLEEILGILGFGRLEREVVPDEENVDIRDGTDPLAYPRVDRTQPTVEDVDDGLRALVGSPLRFTLVEDALVESAFHESLLPNIHLHQPRGYIFRFRDEPQHGQMIRPLR